MHPGADNNNDHNYNNQIKYQNSLTLSENKNQTAPTRTHLSMLNGIACPRRAPGSESRVRFIVSVLSVLSVLFEPANRRARDVRRSPATSPPRRPSSCRSCDIPAWRFSRDDKLLERRTGFLARGYDIAAHASVSC